MFSSSRSNSKKTLFFTFLFSILSLLLFRLALVARLLQLQVLCLTLSLDALVVALGDTCFLRHRDCFPIFARFHRSALSFLGRLRFFSTCLAWPYFLAFAEAADCDASKTTSSVAEQLLGAAFWAIFMTFLAREGMYVWATLTDPQGTEKKILENLARSSKAPLEAPRGVEMQTKLSALTESFTRSPESLVEPDKLDRGTAVLPGGSKPEFGDCLPRNAVFGGFFRPEKVEADEGRIVFVPVPKREGSYVGAGLVMLEHLILGSVQGFRDSGFSPPPLLVGAVVGLVLRQVENRLIRDLSLARLVGRTGEFFWVFLCVVQERCSGMSGVWQVSEDMF